MTIIFKGLPEKPSTNSYDDIRRLGNNLLTGKMNIVGKLTINPNTTETIIEDRNVGENSFITFIGLDDKSLITSLYIKSKNVLGRSFTIGHDNIEHSRTYNYVVIG